MVLYYSVLLRHELITNIFIESLPQDYLITIHIADCLLLVYY